MKKVLILFMLVFTTTLIFAQNNYLDVVYLKNGSIIRGIIVEQIPGKSIKIETADKSLFVFNMNEIEKITKEIKQSPEKKKSKGNKKGFIGLSLGANIPLGKFANENNGAAKTGVQINLINFGYLISGNVGITVTWFGASNPIAYGNYDYMWSHGGILAGPLYNFQVSDNVEWDLKPMVGVSWATILNTNLDYSYSFTVSFGTEFRFIVSRLIALTLGMDYTTAIYNWDIGKQSMSTLGVKGGIVFRLK